MEAFVLNEEDQHGAIDCTKWIGHNPTWFWRSRQVYEVLCDLTVYWSNWHDRVAYTPPEIIHRGDREAVRSIRDEKRNERITQVLFGSRDSGPFGHLRELSSELNYRAVYAAVIRRAFLDYTLGILVPQAKEQRQALNAYWWIMGLPLLVTHKARRNFDIAQVDLEQGRTRRWKASGADLWKGIGLQFSDMVELYDFDLTYYPQPWGHLNASASLTTFRVCCDRCDIDANEARQWLHLMLPDVS